MVQGKLSSNHVSAIPVQKEQIRERSVAEKSPSTVAHNDAKFIHLVDENGTLMPIDGIITFLNKSIALANTKTKNSSISERYSVHSRYPLPVPTSVTQSLTSQAGPEPLDVTALFDAYIKEIGVDYHVVGVFGGQSSGKSTLLNWVFNTDFQVMDPSQGRRQTTKGAFLSVSSGDESCFAQMNPNAEGVVTPSQSSPDRTLEKRVVEPILVVDFEGTDGAERGDEQSFERQLSLFALSIADTLIVNMWTVEIGRFNAANLSLLRTVFEVNLQLFGHSSAMELEKPTLLFVMRDHTNQGYFHQDCESVKKNIDAIWDGIHKPPALQGGKIDLLFNIKYFAFPHYEFQLKEFKAAVSTFRNMFFASRNGRLISGARGSTLRGGAFSPIASSQGGSINGDWSTSGVTTGSISAVGGECVFRTPGNFRGIPLEAVPNYLTRCWQVIVKSKDLDIPSQRELVSKVRCKEIADEKVEQFAKVAKALKARLAQGHSCEGLRVRIEQKFETLVQDYKSESHLYNQDVVSTHLNQLISDLQELYTSCISSMVNVVVEEVGRNIESDVQHIIDETVSECIWFNPVILNTTKLNISSENTGMGGRPQTPPSQDAFNVSSEQVRDIVNEFWSTLAEKANKLTKIVHDAAPSNPRQAEVKHAELPDLKETLRIYGRCWKILKADHGLHKPVMSKLTECILDQIKRRLAFLASDATATCKQTFEYIFFYQRGKGSEKRKGDAHSGGNSSAVVAPATAKFFSTPEGLKRQFVAARFGGLVLLACLIYFRLRFVDKSRDKAEYNFFIAQKAESKASAADGESGRDGKGKTFGEDEDDDDALFGEIIDVSHSEEEPDELCPTRHPLTVNNVDLTSLSGSDQQGVGRYIPSDMSATHGSSSLSSSRNRREGFTMTPREIFDRTLGVGEWGGDTDTVAESCFIAPVLAVGELRNCYLDIGSPLAAYEELAPHLAGGFPTSSPGTLYGHTGGVGSPYSVSGGNMSHRAHSFNYKALGEWTSIGYGVMYPISNSTVQKAMQTPRAEDMYERQGEGCETPVGGTFGTDRYGDEEDDYPQARPGGARLGSTRNYIPSARAGTLMERGYTCRIIMSDLLLMKGACRRVLNAYIQQIILSFQNQLNNIEAQRRNSAQLLNISPVYWLILLFFARGDIFFLFQHPLVLIITLGLVFFLCASYIQRQWEEYKETGNPVIVALVDKAIWFISSFLASHGISRPRMNGLTNMINGTAESQQPLQSMRPRVSPPQEFHSKNCTPRSQHVYETQSVEVTPQQRRKNEEPSEFDQKNPSNKPIGDGGFDRHGSQKKLHRKHKTGNSLNKRYMVEAD